MTATKCAPVIVGVDPSDTVHAWARIAGDRVLAWGRDAENELVPEGDEVIVIEMIASYGMEVGQTVFDTCVQIGRLYEKLVATHDVRAVTRREVKAVVCGSTRAKDKNVRRAVVDAFGGDAQTKKGGQLYRVSKDVWAALAVALAWQSGECRPYVGGPWA